jgi:hypothetical protein
VGDFRLRNRAASLPIKNFLNFDCRVLFTTIFEEVMILGVFPALYIFNVLLILLQILHYFWFYLICQVAISAMKAGQV